MKRGLVLLLVLIAVAGCEHLQPTPEPGRPFELTRLPEPDLSMVAGHVICLDPGHGGPWPGAVAPSNSIRESDVNLRVALRVRDRIEEAGAKVVLTREQDKALDTSSLSADLAARPAKAAAEKAEVFVSIHHNAHIVENSGKNDLEVYYKRGDDGPSLDLAQCMMFELARRVRQDPEPKRLLPGNYKVLRRAEGPAVLLESSYMTHADNAAFLASSEGAEIEAEAIAAGLAQYFALKPPRVVSAEVRAVHEGRIHEIMVAFADSVAIAEETVSVVLDGASAPGECWLADGALVYTFADPLPNGPHRATVQARSQSGASFVETIDFEVKRPPAAMLLAQEPPAIAKGCPVEVRLEARVVDALGLPVADGCEVHVEGQDLRAATRDGRACFYFAANEMPSRVELACAEVRSSWDAVFGSCDWQTLRVVDAVTDQPVEGTAAIIGGEVRAISDGAGWLAVPEDADAIHLKCTGYELATLHGVSAHRVVRADPVAGGVLHGRVLVIDPAYGGQSPGATGPLGARGSDYAMDIAERTASLLRAAGAKAVLTRHGDEGPTNLQRVEISEEEQAEIHVVVCLGAPAAVAKPLDKGGHLNESMIGFAGHYPGSKNGTRLAEAIAAQLDAVAVAPTVTYVVQQTACPAVWIQPASISNGAAEETYRSVPVRAETAGALYQGILAYFSAKE